MALKVYYNANPLLKENFRDKLTQKECEIFCKETVGCAGYLYRRPEKNMRYFTRHRLALEIKTAFI